MATAHQELCADPEAIRSFLVNSVGSSYHLACITPDGPVSYHHFGDDAEAAAAWAVAENVRRRGVYWTVNRVRDGFHGKPAKPDIIEIRFAHGDLDPPKDGSAFDKQAVVAQLQALRNEPSFIIDSGNGLGPIWRLEEPSKNIQAIEAINIGVRDMFGGDHCWNIDRLLRLPGTVNWPNQKKIAMGRVPCLASILVDDQGTFYDPAALSAEFPRQPRPEAERGEVNVTGPYALAAANDLGLGPLSPLRSLIDQPQGRDRSGDALACAGRMVRDDYTDQQILGVLMNPANAVHAHIGDQRNPVYAALRCIEKARMPRNGALGPGPIAAAESRTAQQRIETPQADSDQELDQEFFDPSAWQGIPAPPREWMVPDWVPLLSTTFLTGLGATGKSLMTQQLATCVAMGLEFLGLDVRECRAAYITCEDDLDELHRRQDAINAMLGITMADLHGRLMLRSLKGEQHMEFATFDDRNVMTVTPRFRMMQATLIEQEIKFSVFDNVAHLFAGNENIRGHVAQFCGLMEKLAMAVGGANVLLGHPNKAGAEFSGSTAWENQVRSRIYLKRPEVEDGMSNPDARVLSRSKPNYAQMGAEVSFVWQDWAFTRIEDMPANVGAEMERTLVASSDNAAFFACLRERAKQGEGRQVGPSPGPNYAPKQFEGMAQAKGLKSARLKRAMDRLFMIGAIESYTYRNTGKGRDVTVIRECPEQPRTPTPNLSRTDPERTPERLPNGALTTPRTHCSTTYIERALPEVGARSSNGMPTPAADGRDETSDLSRVIFPAAARAVDAEDDPAADAYDAPRTRF